MSQPYASAPPGQIGWRYEVPQHTDAKCLLLTVGRVAVIGNWYGALGQAFIAWAPMPKRDKAAETRLGLLPARPAANVE